MKKKTQLLTTVFKTQHHKLRKGFTKEKDLIIFQNADTLKDKLMGFHACFE